jgi:hypothetical protein
MEEEPELPVLLLLVVDFLQMVEDEEMVLDRPVDEEEHLDEATED